MTNKVFYQDAAAEVASGVVDPALWIKVTAEMPSADAITKQAKYIQLRAQELSLDAKVTWLKYLRPTKWWHWLLELIVVAYLGAGIIAWVIRNT